MRTADLELPQCPVGWRRFSPSADHFRSTPIKRHFKLACLKDMGDIAGFAQRPLGDVRFGMHDGLKSDITPCPKSAAANTGNRTVDGCAKERVNDLARRPERISPKS